MIDLNNGFLYGFHHRPEYVADCFMKLITECDNGAAMAVVKDGPFLVPDTSTFYVIAAAIFGKIANKARVYHGMIRSNHYLVGASKLHI